MNDNGDLVFDDLRNLVLGLRDHAGVISVTLAVVLLGGFYLVAGLPDRYSAIALVMLDPREVTPDVIRRPEANLVQADEVLLSEIEIMRSREVAREVILAFDLAGRPEFNSDLADTPHWHRAAAWLEERVPGEWIDVAGEVLGEFDDQGLFAQIGGLVAKDGAPSGPVDRAGDTAELSSTPSSTGGDRDIPAAVYRAFADALGTTIRGGSRVVEISFESRDPKLAAEVANAVATAYLDRRLEADLTAAGSSAIWLETRISTLRDELHGLETDLAEAEEKAGILGAESASLLNRQIARLSDSLSTVRSEAAALQAQRVRVENAFNAEQYEVLADLVARPEMDQLKAALDTRLRQIKNLATRLGERHPEMVAATAELAQTEGRIREEARAFVQSVEDDLFTKHQQEADLERRITELRGRMGAMGRELADVKALERDVVARRDLLNSYLDRRARLESLGEKGAIDANLQIVSEAGVPQKASAPNRTLMMGVIGAFGLALGAGLALTVDLFSRGLMRRGQLRVLAKSARILGYLPSDRSIKRKFRLFGSSGAEASLYYESIRRIQSSLLLELDRGSDNPKKIILVTSSEPAEGKSTTARILAEKAASSGLGVILVDCDPKKPRRGTEARLEPEPGVIEVLQGKAALDDIIESAAGTERLHFLSSGAISETTQDLLGGRRMDNLLGDLRDRFDLIVLDSPPVLALSYVLPLGEKSDLVLYLARWRRVRLRAVLDGMGMFRDYEVPLVVAITGMSHKTAAKFGLRPIQTYYQRYLGRRAAA